MVVSVRCSVISVEPAWVADVSSPFSGGDRTWASASERVNERENERACPYFSHFLAVSFPAGAFGNAWYTD